MRNQCAATGDWPQTPSLTESAIPCGAGFTGEQTRACDDGGNWAAPDRSGCGGPRRRGREA